MSFDCRLQTEYVPGLSNKLKCDDHYSLVTQCVGYFRLSQDPQSKGESRPAGDQYLKKQNLCAETVCIFLFSNISQTLLIGMVLQDPELKKP